MSTCDAVDGSHHRHPSTKLRRQLTCDECPLLAEGVEEVGFCRVFDVR